MTAGRFALAGSSLSSASVATLVVGLVICLAGAYVTLRLWRHQVLRSRNSRLRHPSARPAVTIRLVEDRDLRRWRVDISRRAPETAIDIVMYRPTERDGVWESAPIVEPIVIGSGGWALMPSSVAPADNYDVVVAWTARHESGPVEDSQFFQGAGVVTPFDGVFDADEDVHTGIGTTMFRLVLLVALLGGAAAITWRLVTEFTG